MSEARLRHVRVERSASGEVSAIGCVHWSPTCTQWLRVAIRRGVLVLEASQDGASWLCVLEADAGESAPIVARVLLSMGRP